MLKSSVNLYLHRVVIALLLIVIGILCFSIFTRIDTGSAVHLEVPSKRNEPMESVSPLPAIANGRMTLIVAVSCPEGIALSGDSRTTATAVFQVDDPSKPGGKLSQPRQFITSDSAYKVHLLYGKYGMGISGDSFITCKLKGVANPLPSALVVSKYIEETKNDVPASIEDLAKKILDHFNTYEPVPDLKILLCGYEKDEDPWIMRIYTKSKSFQRVNWDAERKESLLVSVNTEGETHVVQRLFKPPWDSNILSAFTLQKAIDFSRHLIRVTEMQLQFEPCIPTVGGPIDTLIITPQKSMFIARKELKIQE